MLSLEFKKYYAHGSWDEDEIEIQSFFNLFDLVLVRKYCDQESPIKMRFALCFLVIVQEVLRLGPEDENEIQCFFGLFCFG